MERDFKGVWVPKEIWLNKNLTILDKAIMVEIDSLDKGGQFGCWAGNEHFAEMFGCTTRKVSDAVAKLIKLGYIKVIGNDGRHRFLRSCMKQAFQEFNDYVEADMNKYSSLPHEIFQSASRNFPPSKSYSNSMSNIDVVVERACEGQDINPYGEGTCEPITDTVQLYASNNLQYMSPTAMQELNSFIEDLNDDLVRHAIDAACEQNKRTWSYTKAILNRYLQSGVKTVGEAKAADEEYRRQKKNVYRNQGNQQTRPRLDTKVNSDLPPLGKGDVII